MERLSLPSPFWREGLQSTQKIASGRSALNIMSPLSNEKAKSVFRLGHGINTPIMRHALPEIKYSFEDLLTQETT